MSARCQTGYKIKNIHFFIIRVSTQLTAWQKSKKRLHD